MDSSALFTKLISLVRTNDEAVSVKIALDDYLNAKFSLKEGVDSFSSLPPTITQLFRVEIPAALPVDQTKKMIEDLQKQLSLCPVIHLTLAFLPAESTKGKLSSKVREMFGPTYLLEIEIDPGIIAGTVLIENGLYRDLSVKKKLAEIFESQKEEIQTLIK